MLHELLLALSGHPSPLVSPSIGKTNDGSFATILSPAEVALLRSLAEDLGEKHKNTRESATEISNGHPSIVCRAVSSAIISVHLAAFLQKVLEVERDILERNSEIVGTYNIVPLSSLAAAFDGWKRKLEWLWRLVQFIQPISIANGSGRSEVGQEPCTASLVLDYLRETTRTGYPDIELISLHLVEVAETAWLKQLSAWILYGRFPTFGNVDLFITEKERIDSKGKNIKAYGINAKLVPRFVTEASANSVLFIGKSLNHIRDKRSAGVDGFNRGSPPELELLSTHLAHLSSLRYPIHGSSFSAAIDAIRLSLSKNALQKLLPLSKVLEILRVLQDFFLLERGEFPIALISAADLRIQSRHNRSIDKLKKPGFSSLNSAKIRNGELSAILAKTWSTLSSLQGLDDDESDRGLDLARELFRLSLKSEESPSHSTTSHKKFKLSPTGFSDFLLPTATFLSLQVPSPLDLFLSISSIEVYSHINAYLLAMRQGHLHLCQLFLLSNLRRDHPSPTSPSQPGQSGILQDWRERARRRSQAMRPAWATISSATFLLTELGEYFQGHVIKSSWKEFLAWLDPSSCATAPVLSPNTSFQPDESSEERSEPATNIPPTPHDPETLSQAHSLYLSTLVQSLLLTHPPFTYSLRAFLLAISHLAALLHRLSIVQETLAAGVTNSHSTSEEEDLMTNLGAGSARVDNGAEALVEVLREIDRVQTKGSTTASGWKTPNRTEAGVFIPWRSSGLGGLERLLLKFDRSRRKTSSLV
jgi:hypothetical protein